MVPIKFTDQLPNDGDYIVACNDIGNCWVEEFDVEEPIGHAFAWFKISNSEFWNANSPALMNQLFIR